MKERTTINLFLFPSSNRNNKYIDLLMNALKSVGPQIRIVPLKKDAPSAIVGFLRFGGVSGTKNVIHVQWSTILYGSRFALKSAVLLATNVLLLTILKVFFNFKIVWTIHNFSAHDYPHPRIDAVGRRILFALSNCIIVQQLATLSRYSKQYPAKKIYHVPHGNYVGAYGAPVTRDNELRRSFGFQDDDIVLLSLGAIAPYKFNGKIVEAVISARKEMPHLKLLIAGKGDVSHVETLIKSTPVDSGIFIQNAFIADKDIPRYLSIADYSIFYYNQSEMTSGGIILSLSYGVPVITRNILAAEIVNSCNGYVFRDENELISILKNILRSSKIGNKVDIINGVREQDWQRSAEMLSDIYARI